MKVDKSKWKKLQFTKCVTTVKTNPAVQKLDYLDSGAYPIISQEKDIISGYCNTIENLNSDLGELVIFGDHTRVLKYIDFPFCVGADGTKVLKPNPIIKAKYLFYYLIWLNVPNMGYARHFKYLKESFVTIPSLNEQAGIVAELDRIQGMIDEYKAQIADLDTLAQSIFLDTFGDPITNPKGWEMNKISQFGEVITGSTPPTSNKEYYEDIDFPFYKPADIAEDKIQFLNSALDFVSCKGYETGRKLPEGSVLVSCIGSKIGKVGIVYRTGICNQQINAIRPNSQSNSVYLAYALKGIKAIVIENANGPVVPIINKKEFSNLEIPLPPLALQELFATRVKAIEALRVKLKEQVADCELLMAERMQYYFS